MNRDTLLGNWKQIKGKVKEKWGKFTDDELDQLEGKRDQIIGKLQEKYGYTRDRAEMEYNEFESTYLTGSTRKY
ncbi:MAG: CsbD family protein [Acidobacteria bacterium]|nr:MAG: CsbD family protein [Acidobacteriota bacterium]RPJ84191.1 MAG: CsbD family protein [Acidobacteriota bacterium]